MISVILNETLNLVWTNSEPILKRFLDSYAELIRRAVWKELSCGFLYIDLCVEKPDELVLFQGHNSELIHLGKNGK